jgi:hypothetical protein
MSRSIAKIHSITVSPWNHSDFSTTYGASLPLGECLSLLPNGQSFPPDKRMLLMSGLYMTFDACDEMRIMWTSEL